MVADLAPAASFNHTLHVYVKAETYAVFIDDRAKWVGEMHDLGALLTLAGQLIGKIFLYELQPPSRSNRNPNRRGAYQEDPFLPNRPPDALILFTAEHVPSPSWTAVFQDDSCWGTTEETLGACMHAVGKRLTTKFASMPRVIDAPVLVQPSHLTQPASSTSLPRMRTQGIEAVLLEELTSIDTEAAGVQEQLDRLRRRHSQLAKERHAAQKALDAYRRHRAPLPDSA